MGWMKRWIRYSCAAAASVLLLSGAVQMQQAAAADITAETTADDGTEHQTETMTNADAEETTAAVSQSAYADGEYSIEVDMTGGSGKATIVSPTLLILEDGQASARITWSSSYYDYMIVDGEKYLNESEEDVNSSFTIPITVFDQEMTVLADTLAMGTPHEIEYQMIFYSDSIDSKSALPQEAAKKVVWIALAIIVGGGILNHFVQKKRG